MAHPVYPFLFFFPDHALDIPTLAIRRFILDLQNFSVGVGRYRMNCGFMISFVISYDTSLIISIHICNTYDEINLLQYLLTFTYLVVFILGDNNHDTIPLCDRP